VCATRGAGVERHQIRHHQSLLLLVISARTHERPLLLHASSFTLQPRWDTCRMKTFTGHRRRRPWPALRDHCSCARTPQGCLARFHITVHRTILIPRALTPSVMCTYTLPLAPEFARRTVGVAHAWLSFAPTRRMPVSAGTTVCRDLLVKMIKGPIRSSIHCEAPPAPLILLDDEGVDWDDDAHGVHFLLDNPTRHSHPQLNLISQPGRSRILRCLSPRAGRCDLLLHCGRSR